MTLPSPITLDDFHFIPMDTTEDMTRYVPGGFHPIAIGDIIGPSQETNHDENESRRYMIIHKLGFGAFATVWLAQKTDSSNEFVAVKISAADGELTNEAIMLQLANKVETTQDAQPSHVLTLVDHFALRGPNGTHSVIVTDVVVPILLLPMSKFSLRWRKVVARGLARAVARLHSAGIVHGDLHLGNVGVAVPHLADKKPNEVIQKLSAYELTVVLPTSASKKTLSFPPYVVDPCDMGKFYRDNVDASEDPQTKLCDFGNARRVGTLPSSFHCAAEACAPELAFASVVEKIRNPPIEPPADVWALGAAIYEIFARGSLFGGAGMTGLPRCMAEMAGSLPPAWQDWHARAPKPPPVSHEHAEEWWASRKQLVLPKCSDEADADALIALLKRVLVLDPALRPTAAAISQDPWFSTME